MQVHFLNHDYFKTGDTKLATQYALKLMRKDGALKIVTFLVYSRQQYEPFLSEMGFTPNDYKNHGYPLKDGKLQIHTVKTYNPDYLFSGREPSEILIAVGVPPMELLRYEDKRNIAHCIIVPWTFEENKEFLSIYEASDIETGECYPKPVDADDRIVNAIGWLKATSYPNEGYHHELDENRLHQMANAIKHYKVPFDYASTVYAGLHNGLIPSAARKTAEAFMKAQERKFSIKYDNYSLPFLKKMMETNHNDML